MNMSPISKLLLGAALATNSIVLPAQAETQRSFENRLRRAVTIKGQPVEGLRLANRMARYKVPGLSVAIIEGCKVVQARGFGVAERGGAPIDANSLFQAASISKPVAALGALRLVEQGKLDLDADVRTRLKGWKLPETPLTSGHPVTLRRLLSHGAGLTVHGFGGYPSGTPVPTIAQILDGVAPANSDPVRVEAAPGSKWKYSGGGFTVSQLMMTEAASTPFAQLMHDLVLAPAKMTNSAYAQPLPAELTSRAAVAHRGDGAAVPGKWHVYPELAAAGLWTTPTDLARFALAIVQADRGELGALISQAMAKDMLKTQIGTFGLGLALNEAGKPRSFSHGGANEGYRAMLVAYPDTCQGAAIMTNSDNGGPLITEVLRALSDVYGWPDPMPSKERDTVATTAAIAAAFVGSYQLKESPDFKFQIRPATDGGLAFTGPDGASDTLLASSATEIFSVDSGMEMKLDPTGKSLTVMLGGNQSYVAERSGE